MSNWTNRKSRQELRRKIGLVVGCVIPGLALGGAIVALFVGLLVRGLGWVWGAP